MHKILSVDGLVGFYSDNHPIIGFYSSAGNDII